jgi:hypothetical protein
LITEIRNQALPTPVASAAQSHRARPEPSCYLAVNRITHGLGTPLSKVGFPIRKSVDQSFLAAPHGLSQRSTSFIASQRQGIHRMPLSHLITLIINAHSARQRTNRNVPWDTRVELAFFGRAYLRTSSRRALIRKTSLSSDRSDGVRSSSRHKTPAMQAIASQRTCRNVHCGRRTAANARRLRIGHDFTSCPTPGAILPLHDVRYQSDSPAPARVCGTHRITHDGHGIVFSTDEQDFLAGKGLDWQKSAGSAQLVEPIGIEPTTSCLQSTRSPN